jgi:hypothetical protein
MTLLEEFHITEASVSVLLSENVPVVMSCCAVPAITLGLAGLTEMETRFGGVSEFVSYRSALFKLSTLVEVPPATRTVPSSSLVALCTWRAVFKLAVEPKDCVAGE